MKPARPIAPARRRVCWIFGNWPSTSSRTRWNSSYSSFTPRSSAPRILPSISFNSGVMKRSPLATVCLRMIMRRHLVQIRFGDFDVIAENGIEPHFQRGNSRARDFVRLQFGDPILAAALGGAQFVERGVKAVANHAAFLDAAAAARPRWRGRNQFHEVRRLGDLRFEFKQ